MAQFGRALRSGRRGRVFESRHPDPVGNLDIFKVSDFFAFLYIEQLSIHLILHGVSWKPMGTPKNPIFSVPVGFVHLTKSGSNNMMTVRTDSSKQSISQK